MNLEQPLSKVHVGKYCGKRSSRLQSVLGAFLQTMMKMYCEILYILYFVRVAFHNNLHSFLCCTSEKIKKKFKVNFFLPTNVSCRLLEGKMSKRADRKYGKGIKRKNSSKIRKDNRRGWGEEANKDGEVRRWRVCLIV